MKMRKATKEDLLLYYDWANEPDVRANSINKEGIALQDHTNWFLKRLEDENSIFLVLEEENIPVGQLRIDLNDKETLINFSIDKIQRGKGYGTVILNEAYEHYKSLHTDLPFTGYVKTTNLGSVKAFIKGGFLKSSKLASINAEDYFVFTKL